MNLLMVDVTDLPDARPGDEVTLIGRNGDEEISADTLAEMAGTINYEILARLGAHIPRLTV
jgi:alanine racemase